MSEWECTGGGLTADCVACQLRLPATKYPHPHRIDSTMLICSWLCCYLSFSVVVAVVACRCLCLLLSFLICGCPANATLALHMGISVGKDFLRITALDRELLVQKGVFYFNFYPYNIVVHLASTNKLTTYIFCYHIHIFTYSKWFLSPPKLPGYFVAVSHCQLDAFLRVTAALNLFHSK